MQEIASMQDLGAGIVGLDSLLGALSASGTAAKKTTLESYAALVLEWNQAHNLTTARTLADMEKNIIDSALPLLVIKPFSLCFDIGSGAGLPALVLAILCNSSAFVLSEPRKKRAAFLRFCVQRLGLKNVRVESKRAQEIGLEFAPDLITSRASLGNSALLELGRKRIASGGHYLFYKGERSFCEGLAPYDAGVQLYRYNARIYVYKEA